MFTDHITQVQLENDFKEEIKIAYEKELEDLLKTKLGNVSEILFFDHNIR